MDQVQHLWNLVNYFSSNPHIEANALQSYYVESCRKMEKEIELPKRIFGPGTMCTYCGLLWSKIDHKVRFSSGKNQAKFIKKIIKSGKKVNRVKDTLVKKSVKNLGNKAIIKCSFCSKSTKINMNKPPRLKLCKNDVNQSNDDRIHLIKKRKKRTKDKTAGLIITPNNKSQVIKTPKSKLTNLNKLGGMINITPSKKSSLHDFITELSG